MNINWYPGHMKKTVDQISQKVKKCDLVIQILDVRIIESSKNNEFLKTIIPYKKILNIVFKSDLINSKQLNILKSKYKNYLFLNYKDKNIQKKIIIFIKKHLKDNNLRENFFIKCLVVGLPNVGKSTFLNCISKSKKASVNKRPGHTRSLNLIHIYKNIYMFDTPGVLFKKIKDKQTAYKLSICNIIKKENLPIDEIVNYFLLFLYKNKRNILNELFPEVIFDSNDNLINNIINSHNFKKKNINDLDNYGNNYVFQKLQDLKNIVWDENL